ncbi:MAG: hypothetical protein WB567_00280, partial [Terracidiphilus sp.]
RLAEHVRASDAGYFLGRNQPAMMAAMPPLPAVLPATMAAVVATQTGHIEPPYSSERDRG